MGSPRHGAGAHPPPPANLPQAVRELRTTEFVAWLADHSSSSFRETYDAVATLAHRLDLEPPSAHHARGHERAGISREHIATALAAYYDGSPADGPSALYRPRVDGVDLVLSVLVEASWVGTAVQLGTQQESFRFQRRASGPAPQLGEVARSAAITRLAEVEVAETVMMDNPLYRLLAVDVGPRRLAATVTLANFASYALTADLLETELVDALAAQAPAGELRGHTPLRDVYLPSTADAIAFDRRECVGGPATLLAIARPARGSRPADYVLLIQERSSRVLNVAGKLAVIPKAFHQPTGEPAEEAAVSTTLERELEEELLGRQDLEQLSQESYRRADPLHDQHRSEPMAWLLDRADAFRIECTAFGINLVTGNYEFACLAVIDDEDWWHCFGHLVEANWETMRVHRYSSCDTDGLAALAGDPRWSNEGLFAYIEGLRRLAELDTTGRVATPPIDVEV